MKYLKLLLWPFSLLYGGVAVARNLLYDKGALPSTRFDLPVIAVGNLTVGGTGKTPHVEYLLRLLQPSYKVATLSRGYKRQSKGFLLASSQSTAAVLGDEPYQYHRDFPGVIVAVSEDRVEGIQKLRQLVPDVAVVVLDDAMQHRPVQPSFNILITDFHRPFYKDFVLPAGLLREPRQGARRAHAVIVSKCPGHLSKQEQENILKEIEIYTTLHTPVFFSTFVYGAPVGIGVPGAPAKKIVLLTGVANAEPLLAYLKAEGYEVLQHVAYPDHHQYSEHELQKLTQMLQKAEFSGASILTTLKDAVKLAGPELVDLTSRLPLFYIPIVVQLLNQQEAFDRFVVAHVQQFQLRKSR